MKLRIISCYLPQTNKLFHLEVFAEGELLKIKHFHDKLESHWLTCYCSKHILWECLFVPMMDNQIIVPPNNKKLIAINQLDSLSHFLFRLTPISN